MDLKKLLAPRVIAVVGASEKEGFGGDTCRNVMSYADKERVYFINPGRDAVFGKKCWPSLESLPEDIDLVVVCTPRKTVEDILRQAAARGAGGAVVYASGYSEMGTEEGREADRRLRALCARAGHGADGAELCGLHELCGQGVRLCLHFGGTRSHRGRGHHFPERPTLSFPDGQPSCVFPIHFGWQLFRGEHGGLSSVSGG